MLTLLRNAAGTFVAKILLGLLILSFAVWGITGASLNFASGTLASVGSATISSSDFQREYVLEINRLGNQFGRQLTSAQAKQFGIDRQVLGRLINQAALDDRANKFSLGISEDRLADRIFKDEAFQNANGEFDAFRYQQLLIGANLSEDAFLKEQKNAYQRQQIVDTLIGDLVVSDVLKDAVKSYIQEERLIDYLKLDSRDIDEIKKADDKTLQEYFDQNKAQYRAPEYRSLLYLVLQSSQFGGIDDINDDEAKRYFEENSRRFETIERRTIRRISFSDENEAEKALEKLQNGASFESLMADKNLTEADVLLGTLEQNALIDKKLAEAVFKLEKGKPSKLIDGDFGKVIAIVDDIEGDSQKGFDELKDTIKQELLVDRNNRLLSETYDKVEDELAAGSTLQETSKKLSLPLKTIDYVAQAGDLEKGNALDDNTPARADLLREAFDSDIGIENDVIEIGREGFLWFEVTDIKEARDRSFEEVKEKTSEDWLKAETQKALLEKAESLVKRMKDGANMAEIAKELGQQVQRASQVKRNQPAEGLSNDALAAAFRGPKGFVTNATGEREGEFYLLKVTEIKQGQIDTADDFAGRIEDALQNDVLETYISTVREKEGSTFNPEALEFATDLEGQRGYGHQGGY